MTYMLTRRGLLGTSMAFAAVAVSPVSAGSKPAIHIVKDPDCGCCVAWARILYENGFDVTYEHRSNDALYVLKQQVGITPDMASCHTAVVEDYIVEGHVPPADIRRLLRERPDAIGLSVPGMPYGSPGMGPESERDAYSVMLIRRDGTVEEFARYPAG